MNARWIADHFQQIQVAIFLLFVILGIITWRNKNQTSRFKVREADQPLSNRIREKNPDVNKRTPPQFLPGVRLHGEPHEILGVRAGADEVEINRAFKELMKKYHPDVMQNIAPQQLKFYQDAATQINHAKEKMIEALKKKSSSRNG